MPSQARRSFPSATQAQLIRANQRDLMGVAQLRDMSDSVLRPSLGTRWLLRWEKEVDLVSRLVYYGLTTGLASQTLGEEYVDIWQRLTRSRRPPSAASRWALIALYTLPHYAASHLAARTQDQHPYEHATDARSRIRTALLALARRLPTALDVLSELNLALFYFSGIYYTLAKRILGIRHITSMPQDPHSRPPSYALLGALLAVRLAHRLITALRASSKAQSTGLSARAQEKQRETDADVLLLDGRRVTDLLDIVEAQEHDAEDDAYTMLDLRAVPDTTRSARRCVLCLEERTASCATECGHLFCWTCIVGWGREKAECPLCRQSLDLTRLQPIANL
ncbi:hypothetical protein EXIGLDRAFT_675525 [Exidia glandulosa HHB12029]|uniref:RING-type E3 ubiquitin transferase n=1 Tax=Exidia glandulosa HHB12029 TaxID=1314781 RepID=A0A165HKY9_EXIGL|nr:hypothetical protein EXIGLDRAFT_675525 [Exidia glandulosa HHB12029]